MKNKILPLIFTLALTTLPSFGANKISGALKVQSPVTNKEVSAVRVGHQVKISIVVRELNLIANEKVTVTYALSVLPKGSSTPTTVSGKLSGKFTLPASEGGAKKTTEEMASWKGSQSASELITIPDFMPEGAATLSVSLVTKDSGTINFDKKINIRL